jgi:hypothetical protein
MGTLIFSLPQPTIFIFYVFRQKYINWATNSIAELTTSQIYSYRGFKLKIMSMNESKLKFMLQD